MLSLWSNKEDLFKLCLSILQSRVCTQGTSLKTERMRSSWWGMGCNFWQSHKGNAFGFSFKRGRSGSLNGDVALLEPDGFHVQMVMKRLFLFLQRKSDASWPRRPSGAEGLPARPCYLLACGEGHWRTKKKGIFPSAVQRPSVILPQCRAGETLCK